MSITNWLPGSSHNALTTELNSLASATPTSAGTAYNNTSTSGSSSAGFLEATLEVNLTFGSSATGGFSVYVIEAPDGTNYGDVNVTKAKLLYTFPLSGTTCRASRDVRINPYNLKLFAQHDVTGVSLAASGNTVKLFPLGLQSN